MEILYIIFIGAMIFAFRMQAKATRKKEMDKRIEESKKND
jgi:cbb3-type cytochrome oxidase subunit 3